MIRDNLCIEEKCREGIEYNKEFIKENREDINSLEEDIKNDIQRYPKDNLSIIESSYLSNFLYEMENIRAKYSIGEDIGSLEEEFDNAIYDLENIGSREVGYINLLWMISLGILLETDKSNIVKISKQVEKENINDSLIDFLLSASDIERTKVTDVYFKENPYSKTRGIIELAMTDKREASRRMQTYMEEWFEGHYDYEWKNAHNEPGYVGFWSFETAALAKVLELDDTSLIHNNHYPYELAHYKNSMAIKQITINLKINEAEEKNEGIKGIGDNPLLERIIPVKWHKFVSELIDDYKILDDSSFYEKYNNSIGLDQIWFSLQEYRKENEQKNLLGTLIVFAMNEAGYILQLDYKEDVEGHLSSIKNYWNDSKIKLVKFILNNDQDYYASVPVDTSVENMYEVIVKDI